MVSAVLKIKKNVRKWSSTAKCLNSFVALCSFTKRVSIECEFLVKPDLLCFQAAARHDKITRTMQENRSEVNLILYFMLLLILHCLRAA